MENDSNEKIELVDYKSPYSQDLERLLEDDWKNIEEGFKQKRVIAGAQSSGNKASIPRRYSQPTGPLDSIYQALEKTGEGAYDAFNGMGSAIKEKAGTLYEEVADRNPAHSLYQALKSGGTSMYGGMKRFGENAKTKVENTMYRLLGKKNVPEPNDQKISAEKNTDNPAIVCAADDELPCGIDMYLLSEELENDLSKPIADHNHDAAKTSKLRSAKYSRFTPIKNIKTRDGKTAYFIRKKQDRSPSNGLPASVPLYNVRACSFTMNYGNGQLLGTSYSFTLGFGSY